MRLHVLVLPAMVMSLAACGGSSPKGALQSIRAAFNPAPPPPDTIPEMLDYSPDLQVSVADMARSPEGVLWQDVQIGDTLGGVANGGDSVEIGFDGWLPSGVKVDSGYAALRIGTGSILAGIDAALPGMRAGGRRKLVLPPGLAFGAEGAGEIPPNAVLVYDLELRRIVR
jgi:FKBP-type peptidyl-prolyl cis-trans isomerase FkpA